MHRHLIARRQVGIVTPGDLSPRAWPLGWGLASLCPVHRPGETGVAFTGVVGHIPHAQVSTPAGRSAVSWPDRVVSLTLDLRQVSPTAAWGTTGGMAADEPVDSELSTGALWTFGLVFVGTIVIIVTLVALGKAHQLSPLAASIIGMVSLLVLSVVTAVLMGVGGRRSRQRRKQA
jgi:hypothetical protein